MTMYDVVEVAGKCTIVQKTNHSKWTDFDEALLPHWFQTLRAPLEDAMSLTERPGWLRLYGRESPASLHRQALSATRWQSVRFRAETAMEFAPKSFRHMAGLICIYNTENCIYTCVSGGEDDGEDNREDAAVLNVLVCDNKKLSSGALPFPPKSPWV
jgi:xylan 1,4-beta-xylosidase